MGEQTVETDPQYLLLQEIKYAFTELQMFYGCRCASGDSDLGLKTVRLCLEHGMLFKPETWNRCRLIHSKYSSAQSGSPWKQDRMTGAGGSSQCVWQRLCLVSVKSETLEETLTLSLWKQQKSGEEEDVVKDSLVCQRRRADEAVCSLSQQRMTLKGPYCCSCHRILPSNPAIGNFYCRLRLGLCVFVKKK